MKYTVNQPMLHENRVYAPGDEIELTERQAEFLLAGGFVHAQELDVPMDKKSKGKGEVAA